MKYFLMFWGISLIIIFFLAIYYMVEGNPNVSGLLYEMFIVQLTMFILAMSLKGKFKKQKN